MSVLNNARQGEAGGSRTLGRNALVVVQVALSMVLLVATGLLLDVFQQSAALDPGYRTDRRLMMTLDTSHVRYGPARTRASYKHLNVLNISGADYERLHRYSFAYGGGGFQGRLEPTAEHVGVQDSSPGVQ